MQKPITFPLILLLAINSVFLISCWKEYSYEGGILSGTNTGNAVYSFVGEGNECTRSIVNGNYLTSVPMSSTNTINLLVRVDSIGTYTITTNNADGIQFSTSGIFTNTGVQTITLNGSGKPVSPGKFTFKTPVGLGCTFMVEVVNKSLEVATFTLSGGPNACTNPDISGHYTPGIPMNQANTIVIKADVTGVGVYKVSTDTLDGISFSAEGTFTALGPQTITLHGNGTPVVARNLTFIPSTGFSSCTFNIVVEDPEPLAIYVLESGFGSTIPCISTLEGTYTAHVPLTNSNTITTRVFVTYLGNFTVSTNTVNGMTFSYSGTYTTLGLQYITLTGEGTPETPGTFLITPRIVGTHPIGGESCGVNIVVQ